jgi:hypothetical protein
MKAQTGRKLEMGARALIFSLTHPDLSESHALLLRRLEERLQRAKYLANQQRVGAVESHTAALRKRDLLREIRGAHLTHLKHVVWMARSELPELHLKFRLPRGTIPYRTFRTALGTMAGEVLRQKEVLLKYGLSEAVLESLTQTLDQFDRLVEQGLGGRLTRTVASTELDIIGDEVVHIVKALDGPYRIRFGHRSELLAGWCSASHIIVRPHLRKDATSAA